MMINFFNYCFIIIIIFKLKNFLLIKVNMKQVINRQHFYEKFYYLDVIFKVINFGSH